MQQKIRDWQLLLSALVVLFAALLYGARPSEVMPWLFGFEVEDLELKNIFRAVMGLYIGFAIYWFIGVRQPQYWCGATISNVIFMGGLSAGRLISLIVDGFFPPYFVGMLLEFLMMVWGLYNLKYLK